MPKDTNSASEKKRTTRHKKNKRKHMTNSSNERTPRKQNKRKLKERARITQPNRKGCPQKAEPKRTSYRKSFKEKRVPKHKERTVNINIKQTSMHQKLCPRNYPLFLKVCQQKI